MSSQRECLVAIYASEYKQICAWVLKNQRLETGGDLFGLWYDDRTAVIQLVLGPGINCRRTSGSFYQDVGYLEKVGSHLTGKEGLCHIGEWHSHHTIGLKRPSGGDERTVWTNMPKYGLNRFLLFIANIEYWQSSASVGCFLFELEKDSDNKKVLQGNFVLLPDESPFRSKCLMVLAEDAECLNKEEDLRSLDVISSGMTMQSERPVMGVMKPRKPTIGIEEEEGNDNEKKDRRLSVINEIRRRCPFRFCVLL